MKIRQLYFFEATEIVIKQDPDGVFYPALREKMVKFSAMPGYWVSPDGSVVYDVNPYGHAGVSPTIMKREYGTTINYYVDPFDSKDQLFERGWVRTREGNGVVEVEARNMAGVGPAIERLVKLGRIKLDTPLGGKFKGQTVSDYLTSRVHHGEL